MLEILIYRHKSLTGRNLGLKVKNIINPENKTSDKEAAQILDVFKSRFRGSSGIDRGLFNTVYSGISGRQFRICRNMHLMFHKLIIRCIKFQ